MKICYTVPGKPTPKGRPRFSQYSKTAYTPTNTVKAERYARECMFEQCGVDVPKLNGPLGLKLIACYEVPKSENKATRELMMLGVIHPTKKLGDIDNLIKLHLDAVQRYAFDDDCQVVKIEATKIYGKESYTYVEIYEMAEVNGDGIF